MISLLVGQAQGAVASILASPLLNRLDTLTVGPYQVGPQIKAAGSQVISVIGGSAFTLLGKATQIALNLLFTFFGLYYLLMDPSGAWNGLRPYIPFSDANVDILKARRPSVRIRFDEIERSDVANGGTLESDNV
jgi:predicted PurR-regulated permease PerM